MTRYSVVCPSSPRARKISASVFQSSVFSSAVRSQFKGMGAPASNSARTLSFFAMLFRTFEFSRKQIVHNQRGDVSRNLKVQSPVRFRVQTELVAALHQAVDQLVHAIFFFVRP